ncbi:hypothetical protein XELAEV_18010852mg [Xenopus laevis]|uniref:START domain-containing protein n=1 Tax=Xenopus laevis TaxID=8355 RepID=A0A974DX66_XENLA|nr:hypothetical protein XELAEV_18010852mg [Xenopus laevis]
MLLSGGAPRMGRDWLGGPWRECSSLSSGYEKGEVQMSCEVIETAGEDDKIFHITSPRMKLSKSRDFGILMSQRYTIKQGSGPYMIATRSLSLASHPPTAEYLRSEVQCADFLIHSLGTGLCHVCVFLLLNSQCQLVTRAVSHSNQSAIATIAIYLFG